jgi:ABC-type lipoprotein release transport system permease subunit
VAQGHYFARSDSADQEAWPVLLSAAAARQLRVAPGARLLVRVQPRSGPARWHLAQLRGVLDTRWPRDLPAVVLPYYSAQAVHARRLNAKAHELLLVPKPKARPAAIAAAARARLKPLVRAWQTIAPDMAKLVQTQDAWVGIMLFIIFAIAAMTVMNTMLMAVWERTREFGVLKSIGMRPAQVFGLIVLETVFLALLAVVVGGGGGMALNQWAVVSGLDLSAWSGGFTYQGTFIDPVWRAAFSAKVVLGPIVMVELVCLLVSLYPAVRASRLKPVQALRPVG